MATPVNDTVNPTEEYNWYEGLPLAADIGKTQATSLPYCDCIVLKKLSITLSNADEYDDWAKLVWAALSKDNLTDLLDISIIRPKRTDAKGPIWYRLSLHVAEWLKSNISEDINKLIHQTDSRMVFADEIFRAIYEHMGGLGLYANMMKWKRWDNTKITDYESTRKFVEDVLLARKKLADSGIVIPPYGLLMKVLNGLAVRNLDISKRICNDLKRDKVEPTSLTLDALNVIIRGIRQELLIDERRSQAQLP
ncbi:hypothetical protein N7493_002559 [Penicillium malachiteum]|uniref:Uncharacterized protein n=1 Tax=Penicillium malachiteum TaxID=1324776 RepID=A0AAD6HSQ6_9EURO|nr:hypothetical protein N7493_002559 [Penicillium malachiteum]